MRDEKEIDTILRQEGVDLTPFTWVNHMSPSEDKWLGNGEPDLPLDADGAIAHAEFVIGEQDMARRGPVARNVDYKKCKKYRMASGLKQGELAERIKVTQAFLSGFETGKHGISMEKLKLYAEHVNVPLKDCFYSHIKPFAGAERLDEIELPRPRKKPDYVQVETRPRPSRETVSEGHRVLKGLHDALGKIVDETDKDVVLAIATQIVRIRDTLRKLEG